MMKRFLGSLAFVFISMTSAHAQESGLMTQTTPESDPLIIFTLADRSELVGRVVSEKDAQIEIRLVDGSTRTIFRKDVLTQTLYSDTRQGQAKVVDGDLWELNPNRTRHLWSPSAIGLDQGEGYISQRELFFTAVAYGITDNVALLAGSILPALVVGPDGFNFIFALKLSKSISEHHHVAAGFETLMIPAVGVMGIGFGSYTFGEADTQFTISGGKPFALDHGDAETADAMLSISGMYRLSGRFGLVSENLIFPGAEFRDGWSNVLTIHGLVVRRIDENTSWDFGFVAVGGIPAALPWFDWTWHFD